MNLRFLLAIILVSSIASAQENLCNSGKASTVDKASAIVLQTLTLSGNWGSNAATVFLPDKEIADGAVLFSHSAIQATNGASVDLTPLALALAQAGAAVIVPERAMIWPPRDNATNREGAAVVCAAQWLIENVKVRNNGAELTNKDNIVIRSGYGYIGPSVCDPIFTSECQLTSPFVWPSRHHAVKHDAVYVPLGEPANGENTDAMLKTGGMFAARFLARTLGLAPINRLIGDPHAVHQAEAR